MKDVDAMEDILLQPIHFEEECFVAGLYQNVEKQRKKVWHDRHIKNKNFSIGGIGLMYDSKIFKYSRNLQTNWLGPYVVNEITEAGAMKSEKLDGIEV